MDRTRRGRDRRVNRVYFSSQSNLASHGFPLLQVLIGQGPLTAFEREKDLLISWRYNATDFPRFPCTWDGLSKVLFRVFRQPSRRTELPVRSLRSRALAYADLMAGRLGKTLSCDLNKVSSNVIGCSLTLYDSAHEKDDVLVLTCYDGNGSAEN